MGTVVLDADVLIGFLDPADAQHTMAVQALRPWLAAEHTRFIAASVYAEILVRPIRLGMDQRIHAFLDEAGIEVIPIDRSVARRAADLRAKHHSLRLPDALALATAGEHDAVFLSLDERLRRFADQAN